MSENESKPAYDSLSESWDTARRIAQKTGKISSLFTSCIRSANKIESVVNAAEEQKIREMVVASSYFLLKISPSLQSVFYFAAKAYHPEELAQIQKLTVKGLLRIFPPAEIGSILGITFLYRKMKKKCNPDEWAILRKKLLAHMDIGALIGAKMRHIGIGNGILIGGLRFLAITSYAICNLKLYQEFKKKSRKPNVVFSIPIEEEVFGCNHLQIASYLASELGYVAPRSMVSMSFGMDAVDVDPDALSSPKLQEQVLSWRGAMAYMESYHSTGMSPEEVPEGYALNLSKAEEADLEADVEKIIKNKETPTDHWIDKAWKDIPEDIAAQLRAEFAGAEPEAAKEEETADEEVQA